MTSQQIQKHVCKRYQLIEKIGSGAYGHVWKVSDKITKQIFALKKIFDAFQHSTDAQRTYRQIMFLKEFQHDNIVKLYDVIRAENDKDLYLVFQYMQTDLHSVIRVNILKEKHKQYIIYQIAKALRYLHSTQLIHRDLKPSNVLINSQCLVKLCDFGLVRSINKQDDQQQLILSQYVATRWYRAPQILLGSHTYTKGVDIWSFGCLMAQLIKGKPMFIGTSTLNQLQKIFTWTGIPDSNDIKSLQSEIVSSIIQNIGEIRRKNINQWFPSVDDIALDLIRKMLEINPKKRITVDEILQHPYLQEFHNSQNQPICQKIIKPYINDNRKLSLKEYRRLIYKSIDKQQFLKKDILRSDIKCELIKQQKVKKKNSIHSMAKQNSGQREKLFKMSLVSKKKQRNSQNLLKSSNVDKRQSLNKNNQFQKYKNMTQGRQLQSNKNKISSAQASKKHSLKYSMYCNNQKKLWLDECQKKKRKSIYSTQKKKQLLLRYLHKCKKIA